MDDEERNAADAIINDYNCKILANEQEIKQLKKELIARGRVIEAYIETLHRKDHEIELLKNVKRGLEKKTFTNKKNIYICVWLFTKNNSNW